MEAKSKKRLLTLLKFLVSGLLIYFVIQKVDFKAIVEILKTSNAGYLLLAVLLFSVSKLIAAFRLNLYFHDLPLALSHASNLKLYSLGMFYNLFLPGGIGGDAYKAYLLNKEFKAKTKSLVGSLFIDRLSGLVALYILAAIFALFLEHPYAQRLLYLIIFSIPLAVVVFWLFNKKVVKPGFRILWKSLGLSILVQAAQVACVVFILKAISVDTHHAAYLFIFLISSIVSVLPISIGGIGLREVTFLYGANYLGLDEQISVSISFIFFSIQALVSLIGIYFHFRSPKMRVLTTVKDASP